MEKNIGNLDAFLRGVLALFLIWFGLFLLDGIEGNAAGIFVSFCALLPLYMILSRKCFVFRFLNISSIPRSQRKDK